MLFEAVVVEDEGGDVALGVAVKKDAGEAAGGVEELGGGLGEDFLGFALLVAQVEGFSLALDGVGDVGGGVAVVAGEGVKLGGGELDFRGNERDDEALGEGADGGIGRVGGGAEAGDAGRRREFADGLALGVEMEGEEPAGELGFVVGAGPGVVLEALEDPEADVAVFGLEGIEHELGLALDDGGVV